MMQFVKCFLEDVGTLFVVDNSSYLTGVLSRKDLLRSCLGNNEIDKVPVHIIMTRMPNITYCKKQDTLIKAAKKMIDKQIDSLPVVDRQRRRVLKLLAELRKQILPQHFYHLRMTMNYEGDYNEET